MIRTTSRDPDDTCIAAAPRELDSRNSDGIHIQLLWYPGDGRVSVAVSDSKTGATFELDVSRADRALDVFHHPYAYAARPATWSVSPRTPLNDCFGVNHGFGSSI